MWQARRSLSSKLVQPPPMADSPPDADRDEDVGSEKMSLPGERGSAPSAIAAVDADKAEDDLFSQASSLASPASLTKVKTTATGGLTFGKDDMQDQQKKSFAASRRPSMRTSRTFDNSDGFNPMRKGENPSTYFLGALLNGRKAEYIKIEDMEAFMDMVRSDLADASTAHHKECIQLKEDIMKEFSGLAQRTSDLETETSGKFDNLAEELKNYTQSCCSTFKEEMATSIVNLEERLHEEVERIGDTLKDGGQELSEVREQLETELDTLRSQVQSQAEETTALLNKNYDEFLGKSELLQQQITAIQEHLDDSKGAMMERFASHEERLDRLGSQHDEASSRFDIVTRQVQDDIARIAADCADVRVASRSLALDSMNTLRDAHEIRLHKLEERLNVLHCSVCETASIPTRKVEWIVEHIAQCVMMRSAGDLPSCTRWFSPKFQVAGASDFQLELRLLEPGDGEDGCDCTISLWTTEVGLSLVCKLYVGSVSTHCNVTFDDESLCFTKRLRVFTDQVLGYNDPVRVGVEVLEAIRTVASCRERVPAGDGGASAGETEQVLADALEGASATKEHVPARLGDRSEQNLQEHEGSLVLHQYVNHSMLDLVREQVDHMNSRMTRRVEWRLEQASLLRRCFAEGESMCSSTFMAAGLEGLQLVFYPSGYDGAREGFCSLFLYCPGGSVLKCLLSAGKQRREARIGFVERPGFFGRTNFCRYDSCVDPSDDTVLLALEIEEAQHMTTQSLSHVAPTAQIIASPTPPPPRENSASRPARRSLQTRSGSPPENEMESPAALESVVRLHRLPGKTALQDVKQLPSIWTPLPVGNIGEVLEGFYKFSDMQPKTGRRINTARRPPSGMGGVVNSSYYSTGSDGLASVPSRGASRNDYRTLQKFLPYAQ